MNKVIFLIRGLPGSGKSSIGMTLNCTVVSADDFFMSNGEYCFDPSKLSAAHAYCRDATEIVLKSPANSVAVANTFTTRWEMEPYIQLSIKYCLRLVIIDCYDGGMTDKELSEANIHNVPEPAISRMRARWEHDWRSGNPAPPWLRKG